MSATVTISIAGRAYEIACDSGQEETLRALAGEIDSRAQQLLKAVGPLSDAKLLAMVSLTLADDLAEARGKGAAPRKEADDAQTDARLAAGLDRLAGRVEAIADRIQKA
jgi:cell division protein ZapA